eukprot:TRINITY_DN25194_c0_g1_i1.p1 TRINITY_DN25194_c0_g1~~TRINITY_DN25194_c0_g1_i1.p1  ORF type:complete len:498 (+),score=105.88 TRINITY_DN25194_c0_g1_i1:113-1606(+)
MAAPECLIKEADLKEWEARLMWQKDLDKQKEARLEREALIWKDPSLDGLSDEDRMWTVIQMGFEQVRVFLERIDMVHHYEHFISRGLTYAAKLKYLTKPYIRHRMPQITSEDEIEAILSASAEVCKDESIRFFRHRYGNVDQYLYDCVEGRKFLSEKCHQDWFKNLYDLAAPMEQEQNNFETKWGICDEDSALFDSHNEWAAAVGCDGFLFLWPTDHESAVPPCVRCKMLHTQEITDLHIDWQALVAATCGGDSKLHLFDLKKNIVLGSVKERLEDQRYVSMDADLSVCKKAAVGTDKGPIKLCDLATQQVTLSLQGHQDWVSSVKVDWSLNQAASCSWDSSVRVWDLRSGKTVKKLLGHNQICEKIEIDFDKQCALSSAMEDQLILWDLKEGSPVKMFKSPHHKANCLSVDWENMVFASGAEDGTVKIWDINSGTSTKTIDCGHEQTLAVDLDWKRRRILTGSWDHKVQLIDLDTGRIMKHFLKARRTLTQCRLKK